MASGLPCQLEMLVERRAIETADAEHCGIGRAFPWRIGEMIMVAAIAGTRSELDTTARAVGRHWREGSYLEALEHSAVALAAPKRRPPQKSIRNKCWTLPMASTRRIGCDPLDNNSPHAARRVAPAAPGQRPPTLRSSIHASFRIRSARNLAFQERPGSAGGLERDWQTASRRASWRCVLRRRNASSGQPPSSPCQTASRCSVPVECVA